jgi:hypothetical protein
MVAASRAGRIIDVLIIIQMVGGGTRSKSVWLRSSSFGNAPER